jgi:solute carrier family 13 (sodium-dependent dicarboxylate transporter), member 2/3/5
MGGDMASETKAAISGGPAAFNFLFENIRKTGGNPKSVLIGFFAAWIAFALILWVLPAPPGLSKEGVAVLAVVVWASVMWVSESMPVGITSMGVPLLLILTHALPWTRGQPPLGEALSGFTDHVVWLCLFAFMVAAIMQLLKLDRRIALAILDWIKATNVGRVIWGFFVVNIALSFMIPAANARSAAVLPVINGICDLLGDSERERDAKKAIVIQSMVYGSMICGVFIMTAHLPNLIMVDIFAKSNFNISYLQWALLQFPYLGMFALTQMWVRHHFKTGGIEIAGGHERIRAMHRDLGPMSRSEWTLMLIFAVVGIMFVLCRGSPIYELHKFQLGIIGLIGMLILFIPGLFQFTWRQVQANTMWGTFLLLGGALTMTSAMTKSGLAKWFADGIYVMVVGMPWWGVVLVLMIGTHVIRIGMLSNVAAIAMLAPIIFAMAPKLDLHPVALTLLVCDTDTFAYLLPTQITAAVIAYSTDKFSTTDYAKVGWLSILIAIAYGIVIMAPWYALLGIPVWDAKAPWPF